MPRIVYLVLIFAMFLTFVIFGIPVLLELKESIVMDLQRDWYPVPPGQKSFLLMCFSLFVVVCFLKLWGGKKSND
jgi:lysylphosphatidylglycerol synthetase-like protein (DUF2156 family)